MGLPLTYAVVVRPRLARMRLAAGAGPVSFMPAREAAYSARTLTGPYDDDYQFAPHRSLDRSLTGG